MATKKQPKQPANTLRCGNIKATILENASENGRSSQQPSLDHSRTQSGEWRNGTSFGLNDLEGLLTVAREAKEWMATHVLKG